MTAAQFAQHVQAYFNGGRRPPAAGAPAPPAPGGSGPAPAPAAAAPPAPAPSGSAAGGGSFTALPNGGRIYKPAPEPDDSALPQNLTGKPIPITAIPPNDRAIVQALIDGRYDVPKGAALRNPDVARYLQEAAQVDPSFDAANAATRVAVRKDFTAGKSAQNITSLNTSIGHLQTLAKAADDLNNGPVPLGNAFGNFVSQQVRGEPTVTNFNTAKNAVMTEVSRVFQGGAPHEGEIKAWNQQLDAANSPAQLKGVISQIAELLTSRLNAMRSQYQQGMGKSSTPLEVIHPDAAQAMQRLRQLGSATSSAPPPAATAAPRGAPTAAHQMTDAQLKASLGL